MCLSIENWSPLYSLPGVPNRFEPKPKVAPFRPSSRVCWRADRIRSGAGPVRVCLQSIPARPDSKRTRPGRNPNPNPAPSPSPARHRHRPAAASGGARARTHTRVGGHRSLPIACENSKYPKGTPFVLNFLYLYTTSFHPMANVGLNAFSYL